jgi:hypothetical protein
VGLSIGDGVLQSRAVAERSTTYRLKNSGARPKKILVEQPFDTEWKLTAPKAPTEKTRSLYRFAVTVAAGEVSVLKVVENREVSNMLALGLLDDGDIELYVKGEVASEKLKQSLIKLRELRAATAEAAKPTAEIRQQLTEIAAEQGRMRANMHSLDKSSDLFKRYEKKIGQQEDLIEALYLKLPKLKAAEEAALKRISDYISNLVVE